MAEINSLPTPDIDPVQLKFAAIVRWVVYVGLALMLVLSIVYATGSVVSSIRIQDVPEMWHLGASELQQALRQEGGWSWIRSIGLGENLAFAALVFFPAATIVVIGITAGLYQRAGNRRYAVIALLETIVLIVAATGLFSTGH